MRCRHHDGMRCRHHDGISRDFPGLAAAALIREVP